MNERKADANAARRQQDGASDICITERSGPTAEATPTPTANGSADPATIRLMASAARRAGIRLLLCMIEWHEREASRLRRMLDEA